MTWDGVFALAAANGFELVYLKQDRGSDFFRCIWRNADGKRSREILSTVAFNALEGALEEAMGVVRVDDLFG
jgi:hypothetical protein